MNSDRYYGLFEIIRNGAEVYYRDTTRNYFQDLISVHNMLGLSIFHKNATLIFPLTPKKDYDATIISDEFNDGVVELLYVLLRSKQSDFLYVFGMRISKL